MTVRQWGAAVVSDTAGNFPSAYCPCLCSSDRFHLICPQNEMSKKAPSRLSSPLPTGDDNTMGSRCLQRNTSSHSGLFVCLKKKAGWNARGLLRVSPCGVL